MFSGHAHTYEHFVKNGRHFVVSGGGGGPRVELLEGADRRHRDLYRGATPRPFHYLVVLPDATGITVRVKGFTKVDRSLTVVDEFFVPFAR